MRVMASGNLTVELIRAQRFHIACRDHAIDEQPRCNLCQKQVEAIDHPTDRVELSPEALASDPWAVDSKRSSKEVNLIPSNPHDSTISEPIAEPEQLSPVVGSTALGGLGVAWVVPGTLLDVVA